ncbi:hypothetical protein PoB_007017100 [Plakobranchus ocellatus]|uniref:Uncharacterized protein n=1 Tax=Plakobranchus ocellatus TaxID=259542 RepID=A0AAV4DII0_9GAST|nr:hypothetical protein PoB_007017100 [Plakobranchus ocellatus]
MVNAVEWVSLERHFDKTSTIEEDATQTVAFNYSLDTSCRQPQITPGPVDSRYVTNPLKWIIAGYFRERSRHPALVAANYDSLIFLPRAVGKVTHTGSSALLF